MVRYTAIVMAAACVALSACDDQAPTPAPVDNQSTSAEQAQATPSVQDTPKTVKEDSANEASVPPSLDLSYSEDDIDMRDLSEEELSRYQTGEWFESQKNGDKKLSVKPKIRLKDDATLEQTMDNYRDSLDGAEMGIEYKTR